MTEVWRRDITGTTIIMPLWDAVLEIANRAKDSRVAMLSTRDGLSMLRPPDFGKDNGYEFAYEGKDAALPAQQMLRGLANMINAMSAQEAAPAISHAGVPVTTPAHNFAAKEAASRFTHYAAEQLMRYRGWAVRDHRYVALLMSIMASQSLSIEEITKLGAERVIEAACEEIRRQCGRDAYTFEEALEELASTS